MSLVNTVNTNKLKDIDNVLKEVGLTDDKKPAKNENKNINKVQDKPAKKVTRLSIEVPTKTHIKFSTICKIQETSMQSKALQLIELFVENEIITFED